MDIRQVIDKGFLILDGAMGTEIQNRGLKFRHSPEELVLTEGKAITDIHRGYVSAGADYVCTNTFQANRYKLTKGVSLEEVINSSVVCASESRARFVALDVGPTGRLMEPMGDMTWEEAYQTFGEIARLADKSGADLVALETFTSLAEARVAVLAFKENCHLPVFCTLSYDGERTLSGAGVANQMLTLSALGVDALGFNCSLGPDEMLPLVEEAVKWTNLPIIAKPNGGLPNGKTYSPAEFAASMGKLMDAGASIVGGCCGTNPEYIRLLKEVANSKKFTKRSGKIPSAVCNENTVVVFDGMVKAVGERINPTGKKVFKEALLNGTYCDYAKREAVAQKASGAMLLDVNCGLPEVDEVRVLPELVKTVQKELPLVLDSSDATALEKALRVYTGVAVINSVNGDEESMSKILPLAKKYGAYVIALCLDSGGIQTDSSARLAIAKRIMERGERDFGITKDRFIVDSLTLSVATAKTNAVDCLDALRKISEMGVKSALGVSNVSFGLPNRGLINSMFLAMASREGLSLAIVNTSAPEIANALSAVKALLGGGVQDYIESFGGKAEAKAMPAKITLERAIMDGLKAEAKSATEELLKRESSAEIIDNHLVPALDEVGKGYESGKLFLPELIASADTAKVAFEVIKAVGMAKGEDSQNAKGKIVLATVKGDIHDIGKNIVKALLENYGFDVIDLGKDVPKEAIVKTALESGTSLVGLSALMTTTARAMADTIADLKAKGYKGKIMVGGAVITEDYAKSIGADYYAKDANASALIAKEVYK